MKIKRRHKARTFSGIAKNERFTFSTEPDGRIVFYHERRPFTWPPLPVDREAARSFVYEMNTLRGKDIEKIGRPISERFYNEARNAHNEALDAQAGSPGRNSEHDTKENTGGETKGEDVADD